MPYTTERGAPEFTIEMKLTYIKKGRTGKGGNEIPMFDYTEIGNFWITAFQVKPKYAGVTGYDMNLRFKITGFEAWDDYIQDNKDDKYKPLGLDGEGFILWKAGRYEVLGDYTVYHQNIWRKRGKIE